jgi:hypothetical protein
MSTRKALLLIRNLMQRWIGGALAVSGVQEKALLQHKAVFEAVAARDSAGACAAMTAHLEEMASHLDEEMHEALPMGEAMGFPRRDTHPCGSHIQSLSGPSDFWKQNIGR